MPSKVVNKLNVPPPTVRRKDPRQGGMALSFGQPALETKSCTKCGRFYPLVEFYLDRGKRKSSCKVCCNAQVKQIAERKKALKAGRSVPLAIEVDADDRSGSQTIPTYTITNKTGAHVTPWSILPEVTHEELRTTGVAAFLAETKQEYDERTGTVRYTVPVPPRVFIAFDDAPVPIPTTPGITVFQALRSLFIREDAALKDVQEAQEGLAAAEKMLAEIRAEMSSFVPSRGALPSP